MTIVPVTGDDAATLWTWGVATDSMFGRGDLHVLPIIAWQIADNCTALPITPAGRAEAGGAWVIAMVSRRYVTSGGDLLENQQTAKAWLQERAAQYV